MFLTTEPDRQALIRRILVCLTLAFALPLSVMAEDRPNFIIIYCDDLGYNDIGPFRSKNHRTPHLDQMESGRRM